MFGEFAFTKKKTINQLDVDDVTLTLKVVEDIF